MDFLWDRQPIIIQLIPSLDPQIVIFLHRLGQVISLLYAIQIFYKTKLYTFLTRLMFIRVLHKYIPLIIGDGGISVGGDIRPGVKDSGLPIYLIVSTGIIFLLLFLGKHTPLYWLGYPFLQIWNAVAVWFSVELKVLSILITPMKSLLFIFWAFISFSLWVTVILILAKTISLAIDCILNFFRPNIYTFLLFIELITGPLLIILTTPPFYK